MCKVTLQAEYIQFKSVKQVFITLLTQKRVRMKGMVSISGIMLPVPKHYPKGLCCPGKVQSGRKGSSFTAFWNRCSSWWVAIFYLILQVSFFLIIFYLSMVFFFLFSPWKINDASSNTCISPTLPFLPCMMPLYELSQYFSQPNNFFRGINWGYSAGPCQSLDPWITDSRTHRVGWDTWEAAYKVGNIHLLFVENVNRSLSDIWRQHTHPHTHKDIKWWLIAVIITVVIIPVWISYKTHRLILQMGRSSGSYLWDC